MTTTTKPSLVNKDREILELLAKVQIDTIESAFAAGYTITVDGGDASGVNADATIEELQEVLGGLTVSNMLYSVSLYDAAGKFVASASSSCTSEYVQNDSGKISTVAGLEAALDGMLDGVVFCIKSNIDGLRQRDLEEEEDERLGRSL